MVNYNPFAKDFAKSRENMKWEEITYFFDFLREKSLFAGQENILDVGCGSGRLIGQMHSEGFLYHNYLGIDMSRELIGEAKKNFPEHNFIVSDMLNIDTTDEKYSIIFFIASFHHLESFEVRKKVLEIYSKKLLPGGYICMTNWALESEKNRERYRDSSIGDSQNQYESKDFSIKFGQHQRYYHSFSLREIEVLCEQSGLSLIENREFETGNNLICIFQEKKQKDL